MVRVIFLSQDLLGDYHWLTGSKSTRPWQEQGLQPQHRSTLTTPLRHTALQTKNLTLQQKRAKNNSIIINNNSPVATLFVIYKSAIILFLFLTDIILVSYVSKIPLFVLYQQAKHLKCVVFCVLIKWCFYMSRDIINPFIVYHFKYVLIMSLLCFFLICCYSYTVTCIVC